MDEYQYFRKYNRNGDAWMQSSSPQTVDLARAAINAIHNREEITVPMFQSIISLVAHPNSVHLLVDSTLIQNCIMFLHYQQQQNPQYVSMLQI